jgi:hypothetical protein
MKKALLTCVLSLFITTVFAQADKVSVVTDNQGAKLQVDDKDFMINGMNWDYFPIGTNYSYSLWQQPDDFIKAALDAEMPVLSNMGVNAIRVYVGIQPKWIKYIYEICGISLDQTKGYLIETRLSPLLRDAGVSTFAELYYRAKSDPTQRLKRQIIDAITTNETLFFRDSSPFDALTNKIIPETIDAKAGSHCHAGVGIRGQLLHGRPGQRSRPRSRSQLLA